MNRWKIDIMDVRMDPGTRGKLASDSELRERLQAELDRLLHLEFDGTVAPVAGDAFVKDIGKPYVVIP
jgi:hypothetical protein